MNGRDSGKDQPMGKPGHETLLEQEAQAFDRQILERIRHGHVPDLRRAGRCEWFRNNVWRDAAYADLLFGDIVRRIVRAADRYLDKPRQEARVLEVACGPGHVSLELAREGFDVTGLDLSPQCVDIARRTALEDPHAATRGPLRYLRGDFLGLAPSREYDLVVFCCSLHHFGDMAATLGKARDLLSPGGVLFISEPTKIRLGDAEAAFIHLVRGLLAIGGAYFENVPLPAGDEELHACLAAIQDEFDYKDTHGGNVQSPLDNEAAYSDMYPALRSCFEELESGPDFAFFDRVVAGMRLACPEREREAARWLARVDRFLCRSGFITPEQFTFIGRSPKAAPGREPASQP